VGYVRPRAFHVLQLGDEFAGLEITVRARNGHTMTEVFKLDPLPTAQDPFGVMPLFIANLDRWNLDYEDGSAVPTTFDAFFAYDMELVRAVLAAYVVTLDVPYPTSAQRADGILPPPVGMRGDVPPPAAPAGGQAVSQPAEPDMDIPDPPGPDLEHLERFVVQQPTAA
jgi:hypothetical protein